MYNYSIISPQEPLTPEVRVDPSDPTTIPKFVDPMPIPKVVEPVNECYHIDEKELFYHIKMRKAQHRFHKYFPPTTIFGYNGTYPGPTIEIQKMCMLE